MPGIITWRVPKRSITHPITGPDTATNQVLAPNAPDISPRLTPRSSVTGLRNTPKVKIRIAPAPTKRPQAQANTIHQRLAKIPVMTPSPLGHSDGLTLFATLATRYGAHKPRPGGRML